METPTDDSAAVAAFRAAVEAAVADGGGAAGAVPHLLAVARRNDGTCRRFLRAHGPDPAAAARAFAETLRWRAEWGLDDLLADPHPEVAAAARRVDEGFPHGADAAGRPILVHVIARLDAAAVLAHHTADDCLRYVAHWMEFRARYLLDDHGEARFVSLVDLAGVGLGHLQPNLIGFLQTLFGLSQRHFPETMERVVVAHAGTLFRLGWAMLRPFLGAATQAKVHVHAGPDAELPGLLGVPPARCPPAYGGSCDCDPCDGRAAWAVYHAVCERGTRALAAEWGGEAAVRDRIRAAFGLGAADRVCARTRRRRRSPSGSR